MRSGSVLTDLGRPRLRGVRDVRLSPPQESGQPYFAARAALRSWWHVRSRHLPCLWRADRAGPLRFRLPAVSRLPRPSSSAPGRVSRAGAIFCRGRRPPSAPASGPAGPACGVSLGRTRNPLRTSALEFAAESEQQRDPPRPAETKQWRRRVNSCGDTESSDRPRCAETPRPNSNSGARKSV